MVILSAGGVKRDTVVSKYLEESAKLLKGTQRKPLPALGGGGREMQKKRKRDKQEKERREKSKKGREREKDF